MNNNKVLVWINCYGDWDPENRDPVQMIGYDRYLESCVRAILLLRNRIEKVYLSGGMKNLNDQAECETTKPELEKRLADNGVNDLVIDTDDMCLTSADAIKKLLVCWKEKYSDSSPLYFCDEARYQTNSFIFNSYCDELRITNLESKNVIVPIERIDNHPNSGNEMQQKKMESMLKNGPDCIM